MVLAPFWMTPENVDDAPWLVRMAALVPLFVTMPGVKEPPGGPESELTV